MTCQTMFRDLCHGTSMHVYDFHESLYLYIQVYGMSWYITVYVSILCFVTVYVVQVSICKYIA
jgi:hypothetical protein